MSQPYTYFIKHKHTGQFYYGVKFGKDANPETFWVDYFTTSKTVHSIIERDGVDCFDVQIRKTFKDAESAYRWEQKVISKIINKTNCINAALGFSWDSNKNRNIPDKNGITNYQKCARKARETMLNDIDENGLNTYQRSAYERYERLGENYKSKSEKSAKTMKENGTYEDNAKKHKIYQNEVMDSGLTRAQETGKKVSKTRKQMFKDGLLEKNNGHKNPSAKIIDIFDNNDKLMFVCHGNFNKVCEIHNLPVSFLKRSYQNNGIKFKKSRGMSKEFYERHKHFEGWYAKERSKG